MKFGVALAPLLFALAVHVGADQPLAGVSTALDLSSADVQSIQAGQAVTRIRPSQLSDELSVMGAIRVDAPADQIANRLADIVHFKAGPNVLQIGAFGAPARASDLASLKLSHPELRGFASCQAAACDAPLANYVNQYRARGNAALITYANTSHPVSVSAEIRDIVSDDPVLRITPQLRQLLLQGPTAKPENVRDVIYWSNEKVGPNEVFSVTDFLVARLPAGAPAAYAAASKQIYASGVYDSSLSLTLLVDDSAAGHPATIVVYLNRSLVNAFHNMFGGIEKTVVKRHARDAVGDYLQRIKSRFHPEVPARAINSSH